METQHRKKILWVEDDKLLGAIVKDKFAESKCELILVKTGEEAFSALEKFTPDAIVVDLLLPNGMNGFDILKRIAHDERLNDVPKMILSNLSKEEDKEKARQLGVARFLVKASMSLEDTVKEMCKLCL
jgi:DNA-binding response OmpR family regulator